MPNGELHSLVERIINGHAWRMTTDTLPSPNDPHQSTAAERELLSHLRRHPFRARGDLSEWIFTRSALAVQDGRRLTDPNLVAEITAELATPDRPFEFVFEFPNDSMGSYQLECGPQLRLTVVTENDATTGSYSPDPARLEGKIAAYSYAVALDESCRVIREILGALVAVGLASSSHSTLDEAGLEYRLDGAFRVEGISDLQLPPGELRDLASKITIETYEGSQFEETRAANTGTHPAELARGRVTRLWAGASKQSAIIRNACGLYARAEVASDPGVAIINYSMCLEGLLLEESAKENVVARLSEAVAFRLGKSGEGRETLRKLTRKLYDIRSTYVHTGRVEPDLELREAWSRTVRDALRREIEEV